MLDRDPPDHTRLRRLVSKAFTPRAVEALRPRIAGLVDGMLDAAQRQGRVNLVDALAFPLPFAVIAEMLGTPRADHERIRQLSGTVVRSLEPVNDPAMVPASPSPPGPSSWPASVRPTGTRATGGLTPPSPGSTGRTPASTSPSARGRTTAWARRWPGWRPPSPSRG